MTTESLPNNENINEVQNFKEKMAEIQALLIKIELTGDSAEKTKLINEALSIVENCLEPENLEGDDGHHDRR